MRRKGTTTTAHLLEDELRLTGELVGLDDNGNAAPVPAVTIPGLSPRSWPAIPRLNSAAADSSKPDLAPLADDEHVTPDQHVTPVDKSDPARRAVDSRDPNAAVMLDIANHERAGGERAPLGRDRYEAERAEALRSIAEAMKADREAEHRREKRHNFDRLMQSIYHFGTGTPIPDSFFARDSSTPSELDRESKRLGAMRQIWSEDSARSRFDADEQRRSTAAQSILAKRARLDPNSTESQTVRSAARDLIAATAPDLLEKYEPLLSNSSAAWVEDHLLPSMNAETKRLYGEVLREKQQTAAEDREERARKEREQMRLERRLVSQARTAEKRGKQAAQDQSGATPYYLEGYELVPEAEPGKKEAENIRKAQANTRTIQDTIGEIRKLYEQYGTEALPTAARAQMESLATDLQLAMKGPEMYALGVLSGPDEKILQRVAPSPTTAQANVLDFIGGDQTLAKLQTLSSQVQRRFENSARSMGYRRRSTGVSQLGGPNRSAAPRKVKVRNANGETLMIDAADLADAQHDGYQVVR